MILSFLIVFLREYTVQLVTPGLILGRELAVFWGALALI